MKRTAETVDIWHLRSAVRFTDCIPWPPNPAVNCWAIVSRPLRGLVELLLVQIFSASKTLPSGIITLFSRSIVEHSRCGFAAAECGKSLAYRSASLID